MRGPLLVVLLAAAPLAAAADWKLDCPRELATTQSVSGTVPAGWASVARTASEAKDAAPGVAVTAPSAPVAISVFDGPPSELADLVPDDPNARVAKWTFDRKRTRDIYVLCHYADTRFALSHKVPAEVTSCTLSAATPTVVCR